jgi:phage terminase large subunit GpA-like protein
MTEFQTDGYVLVKGFFNSQEIDTISRYLENALKRYPENNKGGNDGFTNNKISWYADPLMEVVLRNSLPEVEAATNLELDPTYSFTRVYEKGDELRPHVDRPACEISVTLHIATVGKSWPIYMKAPGKEPTAHYLEPGDACIYKGCEVTHWRDKAVDTDFNVQVMLHYVNKNGPNAGHKFDKRVSLGLNKRS